MGMLAVAKDKLDRKLRRRKLQGGSGVSPLAASDPITGLYYERARWYRTGQAGLRQEPKSSRRIGTGAVHRETSQDPLQYINGTNTYQFVGSVPATLTDISGTQTVPLQGFFPQGPLSAQGILVLQRERRIEQRVQNQALHHLCRCAGEAAKLAVTAAGLAVETEEAVDTFGASAVALGSSIAAEISDANSELGTMARDGCFPKYAALVKNAQAVIQLAEGILTPPPPPQPTWRLPPPTGPWLPFGGLP